MIKTIAIVGLFLALPASARVVEYAHDVLDHEVKESLVARGFAVEDAYSQDGKKFVVLAQGETRDPLPIIISLPTRSRRAQDRAALLLELEYLEAKIDDETATLANIRRWAKIQMKLNGTARRP